MRMSTVWLISSVVMLVPTVGLSELILDRCFDPNTASLQCSWAINARDVEIAQTFPIGTAGTLSKVDVWINGTRSDLYWDVRPTSSGVPLASNGSVLASGVILAGGLFDSRPPRRPTTLDLSAFNIPVNRNDVLAITVRVHSDFLNWSGEAANGYSGTSFARRVNDHDGPWQRHNYEITWLGYATYITVVPEPTTLVLLGTAGLGLLACVGRPRKRTSQSV